MKLQKLSLKYQSIQHFSLVQVTLALLTKIKVIPQSIHPQEYIVGFSKKDIRNVNLHDQFDNLKII